MCFIHNQDTNETFPEKKCRLEGHALQSFISESIQCIAWPQFPHLSEVLEWKEAKESKKTLFIGRSFIKSIDRSVEKSNNSIIDHLVCQAKLLLQYYQDFYSIWKSRSRWTTQRSAIGEELLFVLKCCPTPPTSSRKMAKLLCSHIEPYILEQVMIYFTFCWRQNVTKCGSLLKLRSHGKLFVMELVQKFAPSTTSYGYMEDSKSCFYALFELATLFQKTFFCLKFYILKATF